MTPAARRLDFVGRRVLSESGGWQTADEVSWGLHAAASGAARNDPTLHAPDQNRGHADSAAPTGGTSWAEQPSHAAVRRSCSPSAGPSVGLWQQSGPAAAGRETSSEAAASRYLDAAYELQESLDTEGRSHDANASPVHDTPQTALWGQTDAVLVASGACLHLDQLSGRPCAVWAAAVAS